MVPPDNLHDRGHRGSLDVHPLVLPPLADEDWHRVEKLEHETALRFERAVALRLLIGWQSCS